MHIGQFVLSWTANLSFSRDEQIPPLGCDLDTLILPTVLQAE